jgi:hypothetical protein
MTPSEIMKLDRCERLLLVQRSVFESLADYDDQATEQEEEVNP